MEFKKFSSVTAGYDVTPIKEGQPKVSVEPIDFADNPHGLVFKNSEELNTIKSDYYHPEFKALEEVMMHLAVCHTVVVDKNKGVYNAASPDE